MFNPHLSFYSFSPREGTFSCLYTHLEWQLRGVVESWRDDLEVKSMFCSLRDLSSVPSTHTEEFTTTPNSSCRSDAFFWLLRASTYKYTTHKHTCTWTIVIIYQKKCDKYLTSFFFYKRWDSMLKPLLIHIRVQFSAHYPPPSKNKPTNKKAHRNMSMLVWSFSPYVDNLTKRSLSKIEPGIHSPT